MAEFLTSQVTSLLTIEPNCQDQNNIWLPQFTYSSKYNKCEEILKLFGEGGE